MNFTKAALFSIVGAAAVTLLQAHDGHHNHHHSPWNDCACSDPTPDEMVKSIQNEIDMYGVPGAELTLTDRERMISSFSDHNGNGSTKNVRNNPEYLLVEIPMVYHILTNQADSGSTGNPTATNLQLEHMTNMTNKLYNIYDKVSKTYIQWATFVQNDKIVHETTYNKDCDSLTPGEIEDIVTQAEEWQFKLHVIICESNEWSGVASFPGWYDVTDAEHNMVRVEYRAIACYDDDGNFLCDPTNTGQEVSHTRWWRTRSTVLAHELGHLFGLYHTFQDGCFGGDFVDDTPSEDTSDTDGCPGLLPYDKDRDLFDEESSTDFNIGDSNSCGGEDNVCGGTCAACCIGDECELYNGTDSISEEENDSVPNCCTETVPRDSCPSKNGIDPKNNVMAYIPDYCSYEMTPGQMFRMIAQIKAEKDYIYCNYADVLDTEKCLNVPCASTATSPNCNKTSCQDTEGWFDSEGEVFDCEWYSEKQNCEIYGDLYENFNETANDACCVCGGGEHTTPPTTPPPTTLPPTNTTCSSEEMLFQVDVTLDSFPGEITWELTELEDSSQVVLEGGPYEGDEGSKVSSSACLSSEKCYNFTISDEFGDGIDFPGVYELILEGGIFESGGDFGASETIIFGSNCPSTPQPTTLDCGDESYVRVEITTDFYPGETSWELVNVSTNTTLLEGGLYNDTFAMFIDELCIANEFCCRFTITDSYGDGFESGGQYAVFLNDQEIISGADFNTSESHEFGSLC